MVGYISVLCLRKVDRCRLNIVHTHSPRASLKGHDISLPTLKPTRTVIILFMCCNTQAEAAEKITEAVFG